MGSQFVDLDRDGQLDYLSATFDGSPHVAWGSAQGFAEPVRLKDKHGQRVIVSSFWDYDVDQHLQSGRSFGEEGEGSIDERCVSALAWDWDADGDYDLLLGTYENGHLYLMRNEGSDKQPAYSGRCEPVMAGAAQFAIPGKMTAPRLVDWDADGDMDLIAGGFEGGVWLSTNGGERGKPKFGPLTELLPKRSTGDVLPNRAMFPERGLYVEPIDHDGDGDLDLVVGGYANWAPEARGLTAEDEVRVAELRAELATIDEELDTVFDEMDKAVTEALGDVDPYSEEGEAKAGEVRAPFMERYMGLFDKQRPLRKELDGLVPQDKSESGIWLYERK